MRPAVGLDFGTTNSALGVAKDGHVNLARFTQRAGSTDTFRSILYFTPSNVIARTVSCR